MPCLFIKAKYKRELRLLMNTIDKTIAWERLLQMRAELPKRYYCRKIIDFHVYNNSGYTIDIKEQRKAFNGLSKFNMMKPREIVQYFSLPRQITIHRGTINPIEDPPRLSWSLDEKIAVKHAGKNGKIFHANLPKKYIIAYIPSYNENEVICDVSMIPENELKLTESRPL